MPIEYFMLSLTAIVATLLFAVALYMTYKTFETREKFQPGYELERTIGGYGATLGDKRPVATQNFGIDDSLAGVFSARILTPWDYYARIKQHNMKMAKTAQCKLACAS
jgi:hypothetical protein